jgi:Tol biopolymer transport system component
VLVRVLGRVWAVRRVSRLALLVPLTGALVLFGAAAASSHAAGSKRVGTIAFMRITSDRVFVGRLFVIRPDGSGLRPITPQGTTVWGYVWSPDGSLIAYLDRHLSLWLVRPDGSGRRLLLPESRLQSVGLSWSPDGTRIAITTKKGCCKRIHLYIVPVSGRRPVRLPAGKHSGYGVAWSPRGDEIYYDNGGIWAIRPDGTGRRKISSVGSVGSITPVGSAETLSPDGSQFVFGVTRYSAFGVVNADGTGYHVVTTHVYTEYGEVWSPSGHRILYGRADNRGIYMIDPDSRNNHRITRDSPPRADWPALAWSPNGGSIVYDSGTYKNTDLYVIGTDGRDKVQLTNTPDIDIDPTWAARN